MTIRPIPPTVAWSRFVGQDADGRKAYRWAMLGGGPSGLVQIPPAWAVDPATITSAVAQDAHEVLGHDVAVRNVEDTAFTAGPHNRPELYPAWTQAQRDEFWICVSAQHQQRLWSLASYYAFQTFAYPDACYAMTTSGGVHTLNCDTIADIISGAERTDTLNRARTYIDSMKRIDWDDVNPAWDCLGDVDAFANQLWEGGPTVTLVTAEHITALTNKYRLCKICCPQVADHRAIMTRKLTRAEHLTETRLGRNLATPEGDELGQLVMIIRTSTLDSDGQASIDVALLCEDAAGAHEYLYSAGEQVYVHPTPKPDSTGKAVQ